MRLPQLVLAALFAASLAGPALALNPQPLPPGHHPPHGPGGQAGASSSTFEPPDPCIQRHGRARIICREHRRHHGHHHSHHRKSPGRTE